MGSTERRERHSSHSFYWYTNRERSFAATPFEATSYDRACSPPMRQWSDLLAYFGWGCKIPEKMQNFLCSEVSLIVCPFCRRPRIRLVNPNPTWSLELAYLAYLAYLQGLGIARFGVAKKNKDARCYERQNNSTTNTNLDTIDR